MCGSTPLSVGDAFQDPQLMSEITDSTEPYVFHIRTYMHTHTPFHLKEGSTLQLLFAISKLPASLLLHFEAIRK